MDCKDRHNLIKVELAKRGYTLAMTARKLGVTPQTMQNVTRGTNKSRRVEDFISTIIDRRPEDLWDHRQS